MRTWKLSAMAEAYSRSGSDMKSQAAPPTIRRAATYIGFRTQRYGPTATKFRGESQYPGVPRPTTAKAPTAQR
jgi:hypothetical protein